jgi:hypothetical protein
MTAVEEWRLEQLVAAGDSRVFSCTLYREGCSAPDFLPPRGTAAQRRGYISCSQLMTAVVERRFLEQLLASGDSRVFSRTL